jgi:dimethyl sulfoxide reductase iron-sulfur subunit
LRWCLVIDLDLCSGCGACAVACKRENATPPGTFWSRVHIFETGTYPHARLRALPTQCMQCEEAACQRACPTGATWTRPDGIVLVEQSRCIGCGYCAWACPYNARELTRSDPVPYHPVHGYTPVEERGYLQHAKGVIEKCHFCAPRLDRGFLPACVATCPAGARTFGDLDDAESEPARMVLAGAAQARLPELGTRPKVLYLGLTFLEQRPKSITK